MTRRQTVTEGLSDTPRRRRDDAAGRAAALALLAKRGLHSGAREAVFACLRERGALTRAEIIALTGFSRKSVSRVLCSSMYCTGGLVSARKRGSTKYALANSDAGNAIEAAKRLPVVEKSVADGAYAIARSANEWVREFKELKRDPFEFMRLALMGPR